MITPLNAVMSASLVYGAYLILWCPCEVPCECKYPIFLASVSIPLTYVTLQNTLAKA